MKRKQSSTVTTVLLFSKKDQQIFNHAIMNPPSPNKKLLSAVKKYSSLITKD